MRSPAVSPTVTPPATPTVAVPPRSVSPTVTVAVAPRTPPAPTAPAPTVAIIGVLHIGSRHRLIERGSRKRERRSRSRGHRNKPDRCGRRQGGLDYALEHDVLLYPLDDPK